MLLPVLHPDHTLLTCRSGSASISAVCIAAVLYLYAEDLDICCHTHNDEDASPRESLALSAIGLVGGLLLGWGLDPWGGKWEVAGLGVLLSIGCMWKPRSLLTHFALLLRPLLTHFAIESNSLS